MDHGLNNIICSSFYKVSRIYMCDFQSTFLILLYRIFHSMCAIKKAFDRVWHVALWATMKKYNMSHGLVCSIKVYTAMQPVKSSTMDLLQVVKDKS